MCTYDTQRCRVRGSGKGAHGWFPLSTATVYLDHPVHADAEHTLNIDFAAPERGAAARVAVELDAQSALRLVEAVTASLAAAPPDISGLSAAQHAWVMALAGGDVPGPSIACGDRGSSATMAG